jgi:hypothetical protein
VFHEEAELFKMEGSFQLATGSFQLVDAGAPEASGGGTNRSREDEATLKAAAFFASSTWALVGNKHLRIWLGVDSEVKRLSQELVRPHAIHTGTLAISMGNT